MMKSYLPHMIFVCVVTTFVNLGINKIQIAENEMMLLRASNKILEEQIEDLSTQLLLLSNNPTYDDGLRDGIQNAKSQDYMAGYHNGLKHGADHKLDYILVNDDE